MNRILASLALSTLIFAGCATIGYDFPTDPVSTIKIGTTIQADISRLFGDPWRTGIEDGDTSWTYGYYHYRVFSNPSTRDLKVIFDANGKVKSYSFSQSGDTE
jgi:hypothetical protein